TVNGASSSLTYPRSSQSVNFTVQDFSMAVGQQSIVSLANIGAGSSVNVTGLFGLTRTVALNATVPSGSGVSCSFDHSSLAISASKASAVSAFSCKGTTAGRFSLIIAGTSGGILPRSVALSFIVEDFKVSSSQTDITVVSGAVATSTIKVSS